MDELSQTLLNGLVRGLMIATLAAGFTIVYIPTRVFDLTLAGVYVAVPIVVLEIALVTNSYPLAVAFGLLLGAGISLISELASHYPLHRRGGTAGTHLICSLGIYIAISQGIVILFGGDVKYFRQGPDHLVRIAGSVLTFGQVVAGTLSVVLLVIFYLCLTNTTLGLRLRALGSNPTEFSLRGYNIRSYRALASTLGGLIVASSALVAAYQHSFDAYSGFTTVLVAIVASIIGGASSFKAPVFGGLLLGILHSMVVFYISTSWVDVFTLLALLTILVLRPTGILPDST